MEIRQIKLQITVNNTKPITENTMIMEYALRYASDMKNKIVLL